MQAYVQLFMHPSGPDLDLLAGLVDQGRLKIVTDRVFPFAGCCRPALSRPAPAISR